MRVYVDSDVLIWHLRGDNRATRRLRGLDRTPDVELCTGAMQRAEIVFFTRPDETAATTSLLSRFTTQPVNEEIVDLGGQFYRTWQPGSGTDVNDALLAATVATTGGIVFTLNVKHYPMPEISVHRAW